MGTEKMISLELAQQIAKVAKKRGFELPESEYMWSLAHKAQEWKLAKNKSDNLYSGTNIPAYDTFELGEILPPAISLPNRGRGHLSFCFQERIPSLKLPAMWICRYRFRDSNIQMTAETEPEARGKMLLFLLENDPLK